MSDNFIVKTEFNCDAHAVENTGDNNRNITLSNSIRTINVNPLQSGVAYLHPVKTSGNL